VRYGIPYLQRLESGFFENNDHADPSDPQFVSWFRSVAPYFHAFRGKTFVLAFGGEIFASVGLLSLHTTSTCCTALESA